MFSETKKYANKQTKHLKTKRTYWKNKKKISLKKGFIFKRYFVSKFFKEKKDLFNLLPLKMFLMKKGLIDTSL